MDIDKKYSIRGDIVDMLKNFQEVLEYAFDVLNNVYFGGDLPPIVVSIML